MLRSLISFCNSGGKTKARGRDTKNPINQPSSQAAIRCSLKPILIMPIARDINMAITTDMTDPKKIICLRLIPQLLQYRKD
jgi:hypothetical protein